jgi:hypothetical protein
MASEWRWVKFIPHRVHGVDWEGISTGRQRCGYRGEAEKSPHEEDLDEVKTKGVGITAEDYRGKRNQIVLKTSGGTEHNSLAFHMGHTITAGC